MYQYVPLFADAGVKAQGYYKNCRYCVCSDKRGSHGIIVYCMYFNTLFSVYI